MNEDECPRCERTPLHDFTMCDPRDVLEIARELLGATAKFLEAVDEVVDDGGLRRRIEAFLAPPDERTEERDG